MELLSGRRHFPPRCLDKIMTDFQVALRMWLKSPGFLLVAVFSLGLGIGANTTIFTLINAVFLRPFPFPKPEELAYAATRRVTNSEDFDRVSPPDFLDWKERSGSFAKLSAFMGEICNLRAPGTTVEVSALRAEKDLIELYAVPPLIGRVFAPEEYSGHHSLMLGERIWRKHFGASRDILEKKVYLNGEPFSVIGVQPMSMAALGWEWGGKTEADIWLPLDVKGLHSPRSERFLTVVGRLKPGVNAAQANTELGVISTLLAAEHPDSNKGRFSSVIPITEVQAGIGATWIFFSIAVGCVLLVACANVANMLLAKAVHRAKEIAVRTALGAGPKRIIKQLLMESFVLSVLGACLGILLSHWGVAIITPLVPGFLLGMDPKAVEVTVDWRVLAFTLLLAVAATFLFGMFPALQTTRVNVAKALQESDRTGSGGPKQRFFIRSLVVSEVALSLMLMIGSVGLTKAIIRQLDLNPGYDLEHTAFIPLSLLGPRYDDVSKRIEFIEDFKQRLAALPGIKTVACSGSVPHGAIFTQSKAYSSADPPKNAEGGHEVAFCPTSAEYFSLANLPLVRGRAFSARDRIGAVPVVLLNENAARKIFESVADPTGRTVNLPSISETPFKVIGIVRAYTNNSLAMAAFAPVTQRCFRSPYMLVQTKGDPNAMISTLREQLKAVDPDQPPSAVSTMRQHLRSGMGAERGLLALIGSIGLCGFILSVVGIGSVVNYAVNQRIREFGIRISLGATRRNILGLALREAAIPLSIGLAIGYVGSLILQPLLWNIRTGVDFTEYPQYFAVAMAFAVVALTASAPPARRATRISPLDALRYE